MKSFMRTYSLAMLAVTLGAPAFAQDTGFDVQFKGRFGYGIEAKDNLTHRLIGMGIEVGYTASVGRFGAELGFQYKPGDRYGYDWRSAPSAPGTEFNVNSGDVRRNQLKGATVRFSYEYDLGNDWTLRGGVQMFGAEFREEVMGAVRYNDPTGETTQTVTDVYSGVHTESDIAISPYVGFGRKLGPNSGLEFNIIAHSYKPMEYVHTSGYGSIWSGGGGTNNPGFNNDRDYIDSKGNSMVPHIEIAYVFRF
ncbi:MAG: hypothetical protein FWG12_00840 [Holophagaceae bacterium]|nr:hypothetical protein [Holophagaceae bacterium]